MNYNKFCSEFKYDNTKYEPVLWFFRYMFKDNFLNHLTNMSNDIGFGSDTLGYSFASIFEKWEKDEEGYFENGVSFYIHDAEVIIDYQMFYDCVKLACEIYLESYPENKNNVEECLKKIRERYNVK